MYLCENPPDTTGRKEQDRRVRGTHQRKGVIGR
nr:MAG TPA: hypothetical protein [Caudoviricetes sp.]